MCGLSFGVNVVAGVLCFRGVDFYLEVDGFCRWICRLWWGGWRGGLCFSLLCLVGWWLGGFLLLIIFGCFLVLANTLSVG